MRQRASQSRPSRRFQWRATPFGRWYLRRLRLVTTWWIDLQEADRASYQKLIRAMPPYSADIVSGATVPFIREGSVWAVEETP